MKKTTLGDTGIEISALGMGCMTIVDTVFSGGHDEATGIKTLRAALDGGINFFDTAEGYADGASESLVGKAFDGMRDKVVIATKVNASNLGYADLIRACEASLARLRTDAVDLYQIHWANPLIPLEETCRALNDLLGQGKIRAAGVCNFGVKDLGLAAGFLPLATDQLPYGLLTRAIEYEILPLMRAKRMGAIVYSPLLHGLLTGKYKTADDVPDGIARTRHFSGKRPKTRHGEAGFEAETFQAIAAIRKIADRAGVSMAHCALAWVQSKPETVCTLFGATRPEQVADNLRAAEIRLPPDVVAELDRVTAGLKEKLGHNADLWDSPSRIR